jgi:molybdopterin-guanine dinucleotide biosynthesis protein
MSIICKYCQKEYSSQSSRSNHIKKYHKDVIEPFKPEYKPKIILDKPKYKSKLSHDLIDEYKCKFCSNKYKHFQSRWKHEQKCKNNISNENEETEKIKLLENKNAKIEKEMSEYKKEMERLKDMLQKSLKIHPKTLNKINNQLNNSGTINNITIIQLGHENLSEILNTKQKKNILNRQAMSLNDLVDLVHVSGKYKNFQNVYITNLQSTFAYKFDEKANKFIAVNKNELLNDLVDSRMYDIEKFYEEVSPELEPKKADQIKKFIDRMGNEEDELKGIKKEEIKLILYNNKDKIISKSNDTIIIKDDSLTI